MNFKKNVLFVLIMAFFVLISGCSSQTGGKIIIDNTGIGLEVNFDVDDSRIVNKIVDVSLTLENSGKKVIILKRDSDLFSITTDTKNGNGESKFDKVSLDKYFNVIFGGKEEIKIYQNQKIVVPTFPLLLDEKEFKDMSDKEKIILNIRYDYMTEFSNNVEVDLESKDLLKVTDSITQAAPVQFVGVDLKMVDLNKYELGFKIKDNGPILSTNNRVVYLDNIKFGFSRQDLSYNSCTLWEKKSSGLQRVDKSSKVTLSSLISEVLITCPVDLSKNSKQFATEIKGSFDYTYSLTFDESITLPDKREFSDSWS